MLDFLVFGWWGYSLSLSFLRGVVHLILLIMINILKTRYYNTYFKLKKRILRNANLSSGWVLLGRAGVF